MLTAFANGKGSRSWRRWLMLGAIALTSCTTAPQPNPTEPAADDAPRPAVVATNSVLCDLTQQIARDQVALTCLMRPGQDPHTYEPTPSDRQAIEDADLVLYGGYNFEPDLIRIVQATNSPGAKVAVYEVAVPKPLMGQGHDHDHDHDHGGEADHDHDHGHNHDEHGGDKAAQSVPDPHVWHDAENGTQIVAVIRQELAKVDPANAAQYEANAGAIAAELNDLHRWMQQQVQTIPANARRLVTTHDAFRYFASAYGLEVKGALSGLSTDEKLSPTEMGELVDTIRAAQVPAIFAETTTNRNLINTVAREAGVKVPEQALFVEGPGGDGTPAPTYQQMLLSNTCTIVDGLGGTCARQEAPLATAQ